MDAVQNANSGHPGTPMALAPVAFSLWENFIRHNPKNPHWPNRDRFVLSAGHASMLIYSLLHINGYGISLDDIKNFRKLHSICAGHPEYGVAPGVETTTGPLGQGVPTSVGMAIAEKWLGEYFNRSGHKIIDYSIYSICSDGDLMEGVSSEAASLAGHLGLGNLTWIYDDNGITIEGNADLAFSEHVKKRFESYGWTVETVPDANDLDSINKALSNAKNVKEKPSLIILKSHIAYGSPNMQDNHVAHGAPLGDEEIRLTKEFYGCDPDAVFFVPEEIEDYKKNVIKKGEETERIWRESFEFYAANHPELAKDFELLQSGTLPKNWDKSLPEFPADRKGIATRSANGKILNAIGEKIPWLLGGAADVGSSTKTYIDYSTSFLKGNYSGRNFHFGIREHAMAACINGMTLSKLRPYASTYFVFSDYMKPSIRLAALMKIPAIYIFTHDSIGVGEDGPTHQPIEHLTALRATPNVEVLRPADANELKVLWKHVLKLDDRPSVFVLTRQNVPVIDRNIYNSEDGALKGAYPIADSEGLPELIIIATGSEVHICLEVYEILKSEGVDVRVVSMPCWSLFDSQPESYREEVLPSSVSRRLSVEAGATFGWERYVGRNGSGKAFGIDRFGESAPGDVVMNEFGFNAENILKECKKLL